jgi:hypothetical protein
MALAPGTRIGTYEIVAPLGKGGPASARGRIMNELWRGLAVASRGFDRDW